MNIPPEAVRRLELEKIIVDAQRELGTIIFSKTCNHIISKGRLCYSNRDSEIVQTYEKRIAIKGKDHYRHGEVECITMYCQICDKDFGWFCPTNPKGYCEYKTPNIEYYSPNCVFCGISSERK